MQPQKKYAVSGLTCQRLALLLPLLLALLLWQDEAQAACTVTKVDGLATSVTAPKLTFDTSTPLQTVIGKTTLVMIAANTVLGNCTGGNGAMYIMGYPGIGYVAKAPGATDETQRAVYDTDNKVIPGLAMVLYATYKGKPRVALSRGDITYGSDVLKEPCNGCTNITSSTSGLKIEAEFIKTQHSLLTVKMPTSAVAMIKFDAVVDGLNNYYPFRILGQNTTAKASCRVTVPSTIQLGMVSSTTLMRDGGSLDQLLRIGISCDVAPTLTMRVRQATGTAADGRRGILSNTETGSSAAKGVGVQIRIDNAGTGVRTPVELDQDLALGKQETAKFNRDFYARMVPLSTVAPSPGAVRTQAIVTATFD